MKKRSKSVLICFVIILLALVILFLRDGFSINIAGVINSYPNADKYRSGETTVSDPVTELDISWISGAVNIVPGNGSGIVISEKSSRELNEGNRLHYWLDGTTLRIRPNAPGLMINLPSKELTVTVPEGTDLEQLTVEVVSADTEIRGIKAARASLNSTSGELTFTDCSIRELTFETVSGDISVTADDTEKADISTVSGNASLNMHHAPSSMNLHSVSGSMEVLLPADTGFRLGTSTVSGDVDCRFPVVKEKDSYVCGNGENSYRFDSVSGDLRFEAE